ncbi:serine O-acetyltransferase [Quatrionicoccus australiensis]|uniref:serine O-acetyltransferase n=1 Tax=Quatrionicoccus australiensis TaxID=138118 RepID=UPI001CFC3115|nr:serine O-acetyltransferase [Quatrionicoccus australiensis]MCB4360950.1 serine O-acetyltransferase [Quatrionicoccus australiensis]
MSEAITMTASLTATPGLWAILREDLACVFQRDPAARSTFEVLTTYPGVHAVLTHRLSHRLWRAGWRFPARLLSFLGRTLTNVDIHPGATIGRRFFIDHGACVVIGETAEVGNDVTLYHGVTLGGTSWNKGKRHPTLADGVVVGAGAKILGPIMIGERVRVGANSVVVKNVPADRTVVGVPGRIVDTRAGSARPENGISLDHNLLPDPVAKSIACLIERIESMEKELAELRHEPPPADHSGECRTCTAGDLCCEHEAMH